MSSAAAPNLTLFPADIDVALRAVRDEVASVLAACCGLKPRPKDVSDTLGLHAKLGWQIWNLAFGPALEAFRFLPNDHGVSVFRKAALKHGVSSALLDRFTDAADTLRAVADIHADDREMFEMMLDARATTPSADAEASPEHRWRQQSFAGNSFTFGVRAKVMVSAHVLFPSERANYFSMIRISGLIDLVRTRTGIRWPFLKAVVQRPDRSAAKPTGEPLVESAPWRETGVPLLLDHCSDPLPAIERQIEGEFVFDNLLPGVVGQTGKATLFTAEIIRDVAPTHGLTGGENAHFGCGIRTPSELLVADHIVHRSIFPEAKRELRVFNELLRSETRHAADRMTVSERLEPLGAGVLRLGTANVPGYADLIAMAIQRIGFDPDAFDTWRVQMRYPPIPTAVMVHHTLPPPPT